MFKNLVILKCEPWFLYADNEKDALKICAKFKESVVGVVCGNNIIVKHPRVEMTLEQEETRQITFENLEEKSEENRTQHLDFNIEDITEEIENEFRSLEEGIS